MAVNAKNLLVCALVLGTKMHVQVQVLWCVCRPVNWATSARYLAVYLKSSFAFKCSFDVNKAKFYKAFNCIFGKIGRIASEEVIFSLIKKQMFTDFT